MYEGLAALAGDITTDTTVAERAPGGFTDYLGLDATRPPFDDARVRRAAAHAIDRHRVARTMGGAPALTGGLLPPAMPAHSARVAAPFDPQRARALLAEARSPDGRGPDEIVLAHFGIWDEAGSEIAAHLAEVGFRVRRAPAYSSDDLAAAARGSAHAYIWSWDYDVPDPGRGFLEPLLGWATWLYRNEQLDRLLARAASLREPDARLAAYREFERIWVGEQAAVVPLVYNDHILWRRPWVTRMWMNAIARSTFADAVVLARGRRAEAVERR
jgi:peptide/nickel transport system substrate-binding protein